jgi:hypothetical protein
MRTTDLGYEKRGLFQKIKRINFTQILRLQAWKSGRKGLANSESC